MKRNPFQGPVLILPCVLCLASGVLLGRLIPASERIAAPTTSPPATTGAGARADSEPATGKSGTPAAITRSVDLLPLSAFKRHQPEAEAFLRNGEYTASSSRQWAYIATADLSFLRARSGPLLLRVRGACERGEMGIGVLQLDGEAFVSERSVSAPGSFDIRLSVPIPSEAASLVLRSHARDGETSVVVIEAVTLRDDPGASSDISLVTAEKLRAAGDYWLKRFLDERVISRLGKAPSDWEIVRALCDWVYKTAPTSGTKQAALDGSGYHVYSSPISYQCYILDTLQGSYWCGGQAATLRSILGFYGYASASLDLGIPATHLTHVVTLTEITHDGGSCYVLLDPYFNYALADERDRPIPIVEAVRRIRNGTPESVKRLRGDARRKRVFRAKEKGPPGATVTTNYEPILISPFEAYTVYSMRFTETRYLNCLHDLGRLNGPLALQLFNENWNYLFVHSFAIYTDVDAFRELFEQLR